MTGHEHIRILKRFSLVGRAGGTREQTAKAPSRCQPRDRPEHFHYYLRSPQYTVHVHVSWHSCVYAGMACTDTHEQSGDQQSTHSQQRRPASADVDDNKERTVSLRTRACVARGKLDLKQQVRALRAQAREPASPSRTSHRTKRVAGKKKTADQGNRISDDFG